MIATDYRPQLDALRAFAVTAVLLHHTWSELLGSIGHLGVRLFFVISGFLITGILLNCRDEREDVVAKIKVLRRFYARRFLRIFPAYYGVLICLAVLEWHTVKESLPFHATYTSNFWFAAAGDWTPGFTAPFWSLSIEEQFYVFWPFLVLWLPRRHLWTAVIILILSGPLSRTALVVFGANEIARATLTPVAFDALGLGALLALTQGAPNANSKAQIAGISAATLLIVMQVIQVTGSKNYESISFYIDEVLWSIVFMALVSCVAVGIDGLVGAFLLLPSLQHLGRISYSVYLFHSPLIHLISKHLPPHGIELPSEGFLRFIIVSGITITLASLSWRFFEGPLNGLKRFFPYRD